MDCGENMSSFNDYWARLRERHRKNFEWKTKIENKEAILRMRQRELLRQLQRQRRSAGRAERKELTEKIKKIQGKLHDLHTQKHFYARGNGDMRQYYRHVRYTRPITLGINLLLWGTLFWLGGVSTGLKLVILFFALASTFGSLFELFFLLRVRDRILAPVENMKAGVDEIAKGNYDVVVKTGNYNEIDSLIEAFNKMALKLKEDEQLKAEYEENRKALIANISHDLKTPITSIQGYIEAILDRDDLSDEKKAKYLKIISGNAEYMNKLIDDLFLFSKLDLQKLDFNFEEISVRPFISDLMEELNLEFEEKGIDFEYHDGLVSGCNAMVDARRFHRIIRNIVDNAVKYGPGKSLVIKSGLFMQDGFFGVSITDNGPGIPEDKINHIFERFYRIDDERTKDFASTGLGLAIAKELVEAHGGKISASAARGRGTCFTILIPAQVCAKEG
jgi:signal transduction histidine kinase